MLEAAYLPPATHWGDITFYFQPLDMLKALESYYCKALKNSAKGFGFVRVRANSPQRLRINKRS